MDQNIFDQSLLERVNPVFSTAKMTVYQLSCLGDEDAKKVVETLNFQYEATQNSASFQISREMMLHNAIMLEIRYLTAERIAMDSKAKTIVDLPCGYMPRAKKFAREGIPYYGLDLPAVIAEGKSAILNLIDENKRDLARFCGVDATNGESMRDSLQEAEGPLCILTEGLLMYFTNSEAAALCDNIRQLLLRHGGFWLTTDPEVSLQFILTLQPILGERFMDAMKASKARVGEKSDVKIGDNALIIKPLEGMASGIEKAMNFLAKHGLRAERLIVADYMPEIKSLASLSPEQADAIKSNMKKLAYWKITPIKEDAKIEHSKLKYKGFAEKYEIKDEVLHIQLRGRIDTLTAPKLLQSYEEIQSSHAFERICIDCKDLEYITSAGLRVLLIMQKGCPAPVKLVGVTPFVKKILQETGFDNFLDLAD